MNISVISICYDDNIFMHSLRVLMDKHGANVQVFFIIKHCLRL